MSARRADRGATRSEPPPDPSSQVDQDLTRAKRHRAKDAHQIQLRPRRDGLWSWDDHHAELELTTRKRPNFDADDPRAFTIWTDQPPRSQIRIGQPLVVLGIAQLSQEPRPVLRTVEHREHVIKRLCKRPFRPVHSSTTNDEVAGSAVTVRPGVIDRTAAIPPAG